MLNIPWGILKYVSHHLITATVVALAVLAWYGWHRPLPTPGSVVREIQTVTPGETRIITEMVPGVALKVPEIVTAPSPAIRTVIVEKPIIVPGPEKIKIVESSPETVAIHIDFICIHGTIGDPDCGRPLSPDITAVRSGDGFKVVQNPNEAKNTVIGNVTTTVKVPVPRSPWTYRIGVGVDGRGPVAAGEVQYDFRNTPFFAQGLVTYGLTGQGIGGMVIVGFQF